MPKSNRPPGLPEKGRREILDQTPMAKPLGFTQPPSIRDQVLAAIRYHTENARTSQAESFDEADDFDVDDEDPQPFGTGHELADDQSALPTWNAKDQQTQAIRAAEERFVKAKPEPPAGSEPPKTQ